MRAIMSSRTIVHNTVVISYMIDRSSLGERLQEEDTTVKLLGSVGNREMSFSTGKSKRDKLMDERNRRHREERRKVLRPAFGMRGKFKGARRK